ncbi:hypothetical protein SPI_06254 [Niveomyces insectorum RCEF 264]|uniref:Uncharacterized protein n=1 Tax=Niveomyces insectorum RCEF 264 TaxID=1081102 RepID=A0A167RY53_9HYPO|nr:hypothetical protein SPI_06254 [Niveomyces insectorum RCEF 264]
MSIDSVMETASKTSTKAPSSRDYDTGFPEPFGGSNTTWRHPDANTSPDASISAADVAVEKVLRRSRGSFLMKHRRTLNSGKLTHTSVGSFHDMAAIREAPAAASAIRDEGRPSKDSGDSSSTRSSSSAHGDAADGQFLHSGSNGGNGSGVINPLATSAKGSNSHSHRDGVFRKLRILN